jgi:D-alanyl-D-alanine carboxypeptidase
MEIKNSKSNPVSKIFVSLFSVLLVWGFVVFPAQALTIEEILGNGSGTIVSSPVLNSNLSPKISAKSAVVLNQSTGEVLFQSNGDVPRVPASLVKLTTVLVALDTVPDWNANCYLNSSDQVGGVRLTFSKGYTYKLSDLLKSALVPSFNDAAHALARCSGISMEQFIIRMNEKVKQLGAWNTSFVEPTGLSVKNTTTALDIARIANAAFSTEKIRDITSQKSVVVCSVKPTKKCQTLRSTDELLGDQDVTVIAGKTGFLEEAGYNFTASVVDASGNYYITVVLGSTSKQARFTDSKNLWLFARDNFLSNHNLNLVSLK